MKPVLAIDAKATEHILHRHGIGKLKHIDVACLWMQDEVRSKRFRVRRVKSEENVADPLSTAAVAKHCFTLDYANMAEEDVECKRQDVAMFWDFGSIHMIVTGGIVLSFQLSHEAGLAEGECESACTVHSWTVHTTLQAIVADAPTHSRRLKLRHRTESHLSVCLCACGCLSVSVSVFVCECVRPLLFSPGDSCRGCALLRGRPGAKWCCGFSKERHVCLRLSCFAGPVNKPEMHTVCNTRVGELDPRTLEPPL